MAAYFSPHDYEKIASALSKRADELADRLKRAITEERPNDHHASLFMELLKTLEAKRECEIAGKVGGHDLLGALSLRAPGARNPAVPQDITNVEDVPPLAVDVDVSK